MSSVMWKFRLELLPRTLLYDTERIKVRKKLTISIESSILGIFDTHKFFDKTFPQGAVVEFSHAAVLPNDTQLIWNDENYNFWRHTI